VAPSFFFVCRFYISRVRDNKNEQRCFFEMGRNICDCFRRFAVLQGAVYLTGIEFRAFVPLFSLALIFRLMAALAGYELLAKTHYGLARAGLGFAFLAIIMMFLEAAVWGARSASSVDVADMVALFDSLHLMVLWFVALWVLCWGLAFIQESGAARALGALFIFHVFVNLLRYFTIQFEIGGIIAGIRDVVGPLRIYY
jgi:hypothetical protein